MLIRLFLNREAIFDITNHYNAIWILSVPGKTIYAKNVIIDCPGIGVFDINNTPKGYLEFDGNLQRTKDNIWRIIKST